MARTLITGDAIKVFTNAAVDALEFCLTDDILPLFHAWVARKPGVSTSYTVESLGEDIATILAFARGEDHPRVERH